MRRTFDARHPRVMPRSYAVAMDPQVRRGPVTLPAPVTKALAWARIDFAPDHHQPRMLGLVLATVVALAGSLAADAVLVAVGTAVFPSTQGYVHFQFGDYGKLTVIGVLIACVGWPVVTRISSAPRRLFLRLAVLVTLILLLPDVWLLLRSQPPEAVAVLMCMHLAIAVVTYNSLVRLAPVGHPRGAHAPN